MKFKKFDDEAFGEIAIKDRHGDLLLVQTADDGSDFKGLWFITRRGHTGEGTPVMVPRKKALKLAWAIIDELNPSVL